MPTWFLPFLAGAAFAYFALPYIISALLSVMGRGQ